MKRPSVIALGGILTAASAVSWAISKVSMTDIIYARRISPKRAFLGDRVTVEYKITNDKPIPLRLRCEDVQPIRPGADGDYPMGPDPRVNAKLVKDAFLSAYGTLTWKQEFLCENRGIFTFGPVTLHFQDPLGLYPTSRTMDCTDSLVVYPKILPLDCAPSSSLFPFGVAVKPSWVYQDPLAVKTKRRYLPGDTGRNIDWKATARSGELMTKVYDATFEDRVVICLNLSTGSLPWEGVDPTAFENLIVTAASLIWALSAQGLQVGICTNGVSKDERGRTYLAQRAPGAGEAHLGELLALFSGLNSYAFGDFAKATSASWVRSQGVYPLVVTSVVDSQIESFIAAGSRGPKPTLLMVEDARHDLETRGSLIREAKRISRDKVLLAFIDGGWRDADKIAIFPAD